MPKNLKTKELAQRIDPGYFARSHPMRRWRRIANLTALGVALVWVLGLTASGEERVYAAGPVSVRHLQWENDCAACHTAEFSSVQDGTCLVCHEVPAHTGAGREEDPGCTSCHREHRGRLTLAIVADSHCNACHEEHDDITLFSNHPDVEADQGDQQLLFGHAAHLNPELKDGPLDCAACHVPDRSGRSFTPIEHEAHCARCHALGYDVDLPQLQAPHGLQPRDLQKHLAAAYVEALRADATLRERSGKRSPVPRGPFEPPEWTEALNTRTGAALRVLLPPAGAGGCLLCHVVADDEAEAAAHVIAQPAIPTDLQPESWFDHAAHRFQECASCHDMASNRDAEEVVLPSIASCKSCHNPGGARDSCSTCHHFHR